MARQEKYDAKNPAVKFVIDRFFWRLRAVVAEVGPRTALDAGCGEGELLRRGVLPVGLRPVCLDLRMDSLADVAETKRVRGSVQALPFAARSFDMATCLEVLEHLADPALAVRELARVSRGAVVLSVPHEPYFRLGNLLRGKYLSGNGNHPEHVQHWNSRTFEKFLRESLAEVRIIEAFPWIIACGRPNQL
ncbi:MAG TPA: class I SAM-dependent methyltransferase [Candidatus Solibacter sp.]